MNISKKTLAVALLFSSYAVANPQDCLSELLKAQQEIALANPDAPVTQAKLLKLFEATVGCFKNGSTTVVLSIKGQEKEIKAETPSGDLTAVTLLLGDTGSSSSADVKDPKDVKKDADVKDAKSDLGKAELPVSTPASEPAKA